MRLTFTLIPALAVPLLALVAVSADADEGLWLPDAFPSARVEKAYGFAPSQPWLDHLRLASVRLARGCSGSFVSPRGLVQTNHHCARDCVAQLSTASEDLVETGFYAKAIEDERKCPDIEIDQLVAITDVTARIAASTAGRDRNAHAEAEREAEAAIARECEGGDAAIRCDVVAFYSGAIYQLYRYRRHLDVRLVFAPEVAIATFGGDLDNYEFPRYVLDVTYLRVYVDGRPLDTSANFLRYAARDVRPGELTFTSGNPGSTNRLDTVAQLAFERDVTLPRNLFYYSELRGLLTAFRRDQRRECADRRDAAARCRGLRQGRQGPVLCAGRSRDHHRALTIRADAARQGRCRSASSRAIRGGLGRHPDDARSLPAGARPLRLHRGRPRLPLELVPLCEDAGAARRRGGKARLPAPARIHRRRFPGPAPGTRLTGADLSRSREAHAYLLARAIARGARSRRPLGAQGARQERAGRRRGGAHRQDEARGRRRCAVA